MRPPPPPRAPRRLRRPGRPDCLLPTTRAASSRSDGHFCSAASPQGKNGVPQLMPTAMPLPDVPQPPVAPRRAGAHVAHGDIRPDDWQWLANRDDPEVDRLPGGREHLYRRRPGPHGRHAGTPVRADPRPGWPRPTSRPRSSTTAGGIGPAPWPGSSTPCTAGGPTRARALSATEVLAAARAALPGAGVAGDGTPPPAGDGPPIDEVCARTRARWSSTRTVGRRRRLFRLRGVRPPP